MTTIAETIAGVRQALAQCGLEQPVPPQSAIDQVRAGFRVDLVSLGIDPAEGLERVLAGLVIGLKVLVTQDAPMALMAHYNLICECLLPLIDVEEVDVSGLPDMSFLDGLDLPSPDEVDLDLCTMCQRTPAVLDMGNGTTLCHSCAKGLVTGGMQAMRLAGISPGRPQVGGPSFNRGPDVVEPVTTEVGPKRLWDMTLSELFGRKRKEQHG